MSKKSITKNYIYNMAYQVLILVLPLITIPYLSKVLGPENIGIYGYTLSVVTYFTLFGSLGIALYAQREVAYVQEDREKRSKIFFEIVILRCITMLVSTLIFYACFITKSEYSIYYKILVLELLSTLLDITFFYHGLEEFKRVIVRNLIIRGLGVILIFVLVKSQNDLVTYMLIYSLCNILGNVSLWFYLPKYIKLVKIRNLNVFKHFVPTFKLFIPQVAIQIYTVLDRTMLGNILDDIKYVGYYEQSQKIVKVFITIVTALGVVMIPRIANEFANNNNEKINLYIRKSFKFVYFFSFPIIFGLIAIAENFVPLFLGEAFRESIILVQLLSIIILFIGMSHVTGVQYMTSLKREKEYTISYLCSAGINIILNMILIPRLYAVGAVIATIIAELSVVTIQFYCIRKEISIKNILKDMWKYFFASVLMFIVVYLIRNFTESAIYNIIIQIVVGGSIYLIGLFMVKDELLDEVKRKILSKLKNT